MPVGIVDAGARRTALHHHWHKSLNLVLDSVIVILVVIICTIVFTEFGVRERAQTVEENVEKTGSL